ncbi:tRNA methyltransferase complex GCD14 subunit-domain-containing protein [Flammula alnicola]|nr:tRNA methyltransferase complex GCD14 subunit-domain-containing protein [Flammula alnicola]
MWSTAREVAAGDTVIIWLTRDLVQPLVITPGKDFNTKFGNFKQADFVGVPYGSKVPSRTGKGFIHILRPTPELWTLALPHRTQILYLADIAFITSYLNICQGSKVIEAVDIVFGVCREEQFLFSSSCATDSPLSCLDFKALPKSDIGKFSDYFFELIGTGSASFSHSVARNIGLTGHLWSYEFHEARFLKAREEFTRHAMDDVVTIQHRNVCKDGFTIVDEADAVFLDLPAPWDAVEHAKRALRKDRITRICCFSPCMEQVLRTVNALNEAGFTEITMYETLQRPIEVFQIPRLQSISTLSEKLKQSELKREEKRLRQIAANKSAAAAAANAKRKREVTDDDPDNNSASTEVGEGSTTSHKRVKTDDENGSGKQPDSVLSKEEDLGDSPMKEEDMNHLQLAMDVSEKTGMIPPEGGDSSPTAPTPLAAILVPTTPATKVNVSKVLPEVRGHTSYLTFACLIPIPVSPAVAPPPEQPEQPENATY